MPVIISSTLSCRRGQLLHSFDVEIEKVFFQLQISYRYYITLKIKGDPNLVSNSLRNSIISRLSVAERLPSEHISINLNGEPLSEFCENILLLENNGSIAPIMLTAILSGGISGGKGGFGAMLRIQAKQRGAKKTTDFGACRDLSGRRLRHINDEIILNKWKAAKENGQEFDVEQETATGIDLWFIGTPSWADGIKVDKRKRFMKPRIKTSLCLDWLRAREGRVAPDGAPPHWGCPRGRRCDFAHGEEELRGEMLQRWQSQQKDQKREEQEKKKDDYIGVLYRSNKDENELNDLVLSGLKAASKTGKKEKEISSILKRPRKTSVSTEKDEKAQEVDRTDEEEELDWLQLQEDISTSAVDSAAETSAANNNSGMESAIEDQKEAVAESVIDNDAFLEIASGQFIITSSGEVTSLCKFGSVVAKDYSKLPFHVVHASSRSSESNSSDVIQCSSFYEVELVTCGLMQIGWARKSKFVGSVSGGDGVGDDAHSWAFDGYRWRCWHYGQDAPYGRVPLQEGDHHEKSEPQQQQVEEPWEEGSIIGCAVQYTATAKKKSGSSSGSSSNESSDADDVDKVDCCISFSCNGVSFGPAFRFTLRRSKEEAAMPGISWALLSPALSLEKDEKVRVNLGQTPYRYSTAEHDHHRTSSVGPDTALDAKKDEIEKEQEKEEDLSPIDLEGDLYASAGQLEALGLRRLQFELQRRGLKSGGTLAERAQRLLSVRGVPPEKVPKNLKAKAH